MISGHPGVVSKSEGIVVEESHDANATDAHALIGLSLVLGFVFMLLIDQLSLAKSRGELRAPHYYQCHDIVWE